MFTPKANQRKDWEDMAMVGLYIGVISDEVGVASNFRGYYSGDISACVV